MLHDGVLEGRRTFGNIMKYIMMGTSSNFGNMFSMAGATLFLPFLPMLPMQILLNNFALRRLGDRRSRWTTWTPSILSPSAALGHDVHPQLHVVVGPVSSLSTF